MAVIGIGKSVEFFEDKFGFPQFNLNKILMVSITGTIGGIIGAIDGGIKGASSGVTGIIKGVAEGAEIDITNHNLALDAQVTGDISLIVEDPMI